QAATEPYQHRSHARHASGQEARRPACLPLRRESNFLRHFGGNGEIYRTDCAGVSGTGRAEGRVLEVLAGKSVSALRADTKLIPKALFVCSRCKSEREAGDIFQIACR